MTTPKTRSRRCPICNKGPLEAGARFCSKRCEAVDLGRWLTGAYAIPAEEVPDEEDGEAGGQA